MTQEEESAALPAATENALLPAAQVGRLKAGFLANVSHELRTPLNAIIGFSELLHDERVGPLTSKQREYLGYILSSGEHLLALIDDVLDFSRIEAGKLCLEPAPVDLESLLRDVASLLRAVSEQKRIRVDIDIEPGLTEVVADPARLKQMISNYLSNALKFTPEEGCVTLRARAHSGDWFRLEVEDTGVGIHEDDFPRLFLPFEQLDGTASKKHPGTGLGLALTKRIASAMGGEVAVSSCLGRGSLFSIVLPCAPAPLAEPAPGAP